MVRLLREAQRALNSAAACRPLEAFWMQVPGDSCKQQHNNSHQQHSQAMNYPTIACWLCCWCLLVRHCTAPLCSDLLSSFRKKSFFYVSNVFCYKRSSSSLLTSNSSTVQGMHSDVTALSKASIWREASLTIAHRLPYSSVSFYAYERYKSGNGTADLAVHFIGGGMAGITAASATYPLDLVRTRLAAQRNTIYYREKKVFPGLVIKDLEQHTCKLPVTHLYSLSFFSFCFSFSIKFNCEHGYFLCYRVLDLL
ncbi:hypothetical protein NC652_016160 [Populus alba x Populus x berolinensis]|nr:hypothetical protein NC652_016160 [Populus alba x Populus x berolinensis]